MPYYQNPTWGDMIAQAGDALQRYLMQREEAEMTRIKNTYGNNLEAWRQASIKDPESRQAKLYKKFVGDPNIALPEDPQVAAARMQQENLARWIDETQDPQLKQALRGLLYGAPAGVVEKSIAMMPQPPKQADVVARKDKLQELYPNSTPLQRAEMARSDVTGNNPWMTTTTPGRVNPDLPYSAMSPTVYDYKMEQVSPDVYESQMGQTKQQITREDKLKRWSDLKAQKEQAINRLAEMDKLRKETFEFQKSMAKQRLGLSQDSNARIAHNAKLQAVNALLNGLSKEATMKRQQLAPLAKELDDLNAMVAKGYDVDETRRASLQTQVDNLNSDIQNKNTEYSNTLAALKADLSAPSEPASPTGGVKTGAPSGKKKDILDLGL